MHPGHVAAHLAAFATVPAIGMVCGAASVVDAEGGLVPEHVVERGGLGPLDRTFGPGELLPLLALGNPLRCSTVTLRVEAHEEAGGFDPSYRYVVDWEFWLRLGRHWPVAWRASPTVSIRWHRASETHRFKTGTTDLDETVRLLDGLFAREGAGWPDAVLLHRAADRRLARAFLNRAHDALRAGDSVLARSCLFRGLGLRPALLGAIAADPRLALEMTALASSPRLASWLFARGQRG